MQDLYYNATFYTMTTPPKASAVVIEDGRFLAVGNEGQLRADYPDAIEHDLNEGFVFPGFIDAYSAPGIDAYMRYCRQEQISEAEIKEWVTDAWDHLRDKGVSRLVLRDRNNTRPFRKNDPRDLATPESSFIYDMSYVTGLNADLHYSLGGKKGILKCRNRVMALEFDHRRIMFAVRNNNNGKLKEETEFEGYEDYTNPNFKKQKEVAKMFFYTIATNYSLQAYISHDYKNEPTISYSEQKDSIVPGNSIWLDNLFHKNDGYLCPLVLNPYRDKGVINMANEEHLTTQRLEAILIEEDKDHPFIPDYQYDNIVYSFRPRTIQYGFRSIIGNARLYFTKEEIDAAVKFYHQLPEG